MNIYKGVREVPVYGGSLQRLQVIWFAMLAFLLFLLEEAKALDWLQKPEHKLGISPGIWPLANPYKMPILELEEANRRLIGKAPEGYGDKTVAPGQIEHVLKLIDHWNSAVEKNQKDEARAIAQCAGALIRSNWNLVNSAALHLNRIAGEKYFHPLKWLEKAAPAKTTRSKTKPKAPKPKKKAKGKR